MWCVRNTFAQVGEQFAGLARRDDESYREYFEEEQRRQRREWPLNGVNLFVRHHTSPHFSQGFVVRAKGSRMDQYKDGSALTCPV